MHIGILETGRPSDDLLAKFSDYPAMCEKLMGRAGGALEFSSFAALDGILPEQVDQCDAWMITGSKFGVYESHTWIEKLKVFLRQAYQADIPIIGICFGHQILAEALGGRVIKSDKGWGVGIHQYPIHRNHSWMMGDEETLSIQAYHQDQVVEVPEDAEVVAGTDFCPNALLVYGNKALSFQGHPEFGEDYARALIEARRGTILSDEIADGGIERVGLPHDSEKVAKWIMAFLDQRQAAG